MDQSRMPLRAQALRRPKHAGAAKEMDGTRHRLADLDLLATWGARLCARARSQQAHTRARGGAHGRAARPPGWGWPQLRGAGDPHMYVIGGDGTLVYMGGIDDKQSTR